MKISERTSKRPNNGKPWSKLSLKMLVKLYPHNHDFRLARMFGRTEESVRSQGERFGLHKEYDDKFRPLRATKTRRWSNEEIRTLKKLYLTHTFEEISDVIDRTRVAIYAKAQQLKLRKLRFWTRKEYRILRKLYKIKSYLELSRILNRTPEALMARAAQLGLDRKFDWWTEREINLLIKHYPTMQTKELAKLIGRSARKLVMKAHVLGMRKDRESFVSGGRRWNKEELEEVYRLYKHHTAPEVADMVGCRYKAVRVLLRHHSPGKLKLWTPREDAIVRKYYRKMTQKELGAKLGRSWKSVGGRVETLGLIGRSVWKGNEVQILKREFKRGTPIKKIANLLGKSKNTCNHEITALGLRPMRTIRGNYDF